MKRTIFTMSAALCLAFSSVLLSCDGIAQKINGGGRADSYETKEFIISGTLSLDGAVPSEIASVFRNETENESGNAKAAANENVRTAVPTIPSTFNYKVLATEAGGEKVEVKGYGNSFTIKLSSGTWTLNAEGYSSSSKTTSTKILEGTSSSITLNNASPVNNNISITLSPINSGTGTVSLAVGWENASNIKSAKMTFEDLPNITPCIRSSPSGTTSLIFSGIQSGSHTARIDFYDSNNVSGQDDKGTLLYSTHESINVFQNLTTDTWQGNAPYFTETNGKTEFKVTKTLVDDFLPKTFYVQGSGGTYIPQTEASDSNSGTYFDPFATLQKALDTVKEINALTSSYTYKIYVDGTLEGKPEDFKSTNQNALACINETSRRLELTIEGLKGSGNTSGATIDAKRTALENGRVFYIKSTVTSSSITIKNLTIKGGNLGTSGNGAGILVQGNLTLSSCTVTDNTCGTSARGGGISTETGSFTLTLNENTTVSKNSAGNYGGGIFANMNTTLNITDATITGNSSGSGGGIYATIGASLNIDKATITENSASSNGAGIHLNSAEATLNNVTITNNKGTANSTKGGGIYMSSSGKTVQITGGRISGNNSVQEGGGIYLNEGTLGLKDATISGNSLSSGNSDGKSIYATNKGTINFAGSTVTTSENTEEDVCLEVHEPDGAKEFAKIYVTKNLSGGTYPKNDKNEDIACYLKFANTNYEKLVNQTIIQKTPELDEKSITMFSLLNTTEYKISPSEITGGNIGKGMNGYRGVLLKITSP